MRNRSSIVSLGSGLEQWVRTRKLRVHTNQDSPSNAINHVLTEIGAAEKAIDLSAVQARDCLRRFLCCCVLVTIHQNLVAWNSMNSMPFLIR